ncbi:MAG: hypothetical protein ACYC6X_00120 [Minisyncoccota bacterium]
MAYFARKLRYAAYNEDVGSDFIALVELAKKKGGRPVEFVLYRASEGRKGNRKEMIRLSAETAEDAIKRFWPLDEGTGEEFPGHDSNQWKKTSFWLYLVATVYERLLPGTWARVGMPRSWRTRKKKPLQFGNLAHILLVHQARLRGLLHEKLKLENGATYAEIQEKIAEVEEEISFILATIKSTKAEMRYRVYQMFPEIAGKIPRRVLRKQHELQGHRYPAVI